MGNRARSARLQLHTINCNINNRRGHMREGKTRISLIYCLNISVSHAMLAFHNYKLIIFNLKVFLI